MTALERLRHLHAELMTRGEVGLAGQLYSLIADIERLIARSEKLEDVAKDAAVVYAAPGISNPAWVDLGDSLRALRALDATGGGE